MAEMKSFRQEAERLFVQYRKLEMDLDNLEILGRTLLQKYRAQKDDEGLLDEIDLNFRQQQAILKQLYLISNQLGQIFREQADYIAGKS